MSFVDIFLRLIYHVHKQLTFKDVLKPLFLVALQFQINSNTPTALLLCDLSHQPAHFDSFADAFIEKFHKKILLTGDLQSFSMTNFVCFLQEFSNQS